MSRIISGLYGGLYLHHPKHAIRPTTGKVKEYIFNVLQSLEGRRVIDLFSGTGALGIEALSHDAAHVTFVDSDLRSLKLIKENLALINAPKSSWLCVRANALNCFDRNSDRYDLILADPPYELVLPPAFFESCREHLTDAGRFILEYSTRTVPDSGGWEAARVKRMGDTTVRIYAAP